MPYWVEYQPLTIWGASAFLSLSVLLLFCCHMSLYWFLQTFCSKIAIILPELKDVTTVLVLHHVDGSRSKFSCTQSMFVVVRKAGSEWSFPAWENASAVTGELPVHLMSFLSFHPEAVVPVHIHSRWGVLGEEWEPPIAFLTFTAVPDSCFFRMEHKK